MIFVQLQASSSTLFEESLQSFGRREALKEGKVADTTP